MIPKRLRIQGFLSYLEPVDLQFDSFDLACISGSNGAGKSSLLDAITWVLFGEARRRDDAVINSRTDTAEIILDFDYENSSYRVQRIKRREKTTQLEFYIQTAEGDWKALTEHSVTETEKRINATLRMDYDTFINASFFLQGKADEFAQKNPTQRKQILGNILGLEQWDEYKKRAEAKRKSLENDLAGIAGSIEEIMRELNEEDERRITLAQKEELLKLATIARKEKAKSVDTNHKLKAQFDAQYLTVRVLQGQYEGSLKELDSLTTKINELNTEKTRLDGILENAAEIEKDYSAWQEADRKKKDYEKLALEYRPLYDALQKIESHLKTEQARLEADQKNLQLSEKKYSAMEGALPSQEQRLESIRKEIESIEVEIQQKEKIDLEERLILDSIASGKKHIQQLDEDIAKIDQRVASLAETDEANCPTCGQPLSNEHRAKVLADMADERTQKTAQKESARAEIGAQQTRQKDIAVQKAKIQSAEESLMRKLEDRARQETTVTTNRQQVDAWNKSERKRLDEIDLQLKEDNYLPEERLKLNDLRERISKLGYHEQKHREASKAFLDLSGCDQKKHELDIAKSALEPVLKQLADDQAREAKLVLETEKFKSDFEQSQSQYESGIASLPDMQAEEKELETLDAREKTLQGEVGAARQKVDVLETLKANKQEHESETKVIRSQVATMKMLEKAFGKDGIPAMLIEDALPSIQERANDILDRLSSGAMSVRFETQKDLKTRDEKKETLDIVISDGAGQRAYEMYSGGEAFRVNFAIRLALSHLLAQRAGARLQTLVIDEGFGSQDTDGRQKLIEAINLVKPDYAKILVITHLEELKDAFPARIEVEKTSQGSQVKVITA